MDIVIGDVYSKTVKNKTLRVRLIERGIIEQFGAPFEGISYPIDGVKLKALNKIADISKGEIFEMSIEGFSTYTKE